MSADPALDAAAAGPPEGARLAAWPSIARDMPFLPAFWGAPDFAPLWAPPGRLDGVLRWGYRINARLAGAVAALRGLPGYTAEDGFLRSVGLGKAGARAWSVLFDDLGLYYDATRPSRLEALVASAAAVPLAGRGDDLAAALVRHRLSKYNNAADRPVSLPRIAGRRTVILVDQVAGDRSVPAALAGEAAFAQLLADALADPSIRPVVRAHPDCVAGYARGYLWDHVKAGARVEILDEAVAAHAVLDAADAVWTVSSQLGFDALLRGLPVRCYGMPFYAGWGLTEDVCADPRAAAARARRSRRPTPGELTAAALILYPRYVDPASGRRITAEAAVAGLVRARDAGG